MTEQETAAFIVVNGELAVAAVDRANLRECVALAIVVIERIGTTDANSSDNIRRAEKWLAVAGKLLSQTAPEKY